MPYKDPSKQSAYQSRRLKQRRLDWISQHGPCANCGGSERLEVDHINPEEKVSHRVWSWSAEKRAEELAKCQVLCHDCHKAKTFAQTTPHTAHGRVWMYQKYGCRCEECRVAKSLSYAKT